MGNKAKAAKKIAAKATKAVSKNADEMVEAAAKISSNPGFGELDDVARKAQKEITSQSGAILDDAEAKLRNFGQKKAAQDAFGGTPSNPTMVETSDGQMTLNFGQDMSAPKPSSAPVEASVPSGGQMEGQLTIEDGVREMQKEKVRKRIDANRQGRERTQQARQEAANRRIDAEADARMYDDAHLQDDGQYSLFDLNKNPELRANGGKSTPQPEIAANEPVRPQQVQGQQSFIVNEKTGDMTYTSAFEQKQRQARIDQLDELDGNLEKKSLGQNVHDLLTGKGDASNRIRGRKTRAEDMAKANQDIADARAKFIETGEGDIEKMRFYDKQSYYAHVSGEGKKAKPQFNSDDWTDLGQHGTTAPNGKIPADIAEENATNGFNFDGIANWAKENSLIVAGGLVAGAMILTDD